ncbi:baseplate J/gp47 family protein [Paenibacillus vulneris]|uniref:Baseplate J/gp47 family protein n=1 Tax=Paenibacillus vulneris TaxID=1133364 RepID=A0ABW3UZX6_9BACL
MYESQSFKIILQRMLDRIPSEIDKREGSIIYDALAPAAWELAEIYNQLDVGLRQSFGTTATGLYLDLRAVDYGITRKLATKAIHKGTFFNAANQPMDIEIGSRFAVGNLILRAIARIDRGQYQLECESSGVSGNAASGNLLPINYIDGLTTAIISGLLIPGTDDESDEDFRKRYLESVRAPSTSGNKADYRNWALEVDGVGDVQVLPLWNGPGTVKVVVLDANKQPASESLLAEVQAYISPTDGTGEGKAPIGATVTVASAMGVTVNVAAKVELSGNRTLSQVTEDFEMALVTYLKDIAFSPDPNVKYVRVGAILLDVPGVQDYSAFKINGGEGNVTIEVDSVAVMGTVTLS